MGKSGRQVLKKELPDLKRRLEIDTVIVNGENAAGGFGITPKICEEFYELGVNVITTGNHVWDQKEIIPHISKDSYILRPHNFPASVPGKGFVIYEDAMKRKVLVINVMGRLFMDPLNDPIETIYSITKNYKMGENVSAIVIDVHGEASSEKMAIGHAFDGEVSFIVGTHTHIPTMDAQILEHGSAFQSDAGMCGDYNSVIGMNKNNSLNKFLKKESTKHFPATGSATLSGVIVEADKENGLAKNIENFIYGGDLKNSH